MSLNSILPLLFDAFLFFAYGLLIGYCFELWQIAKDKYPVAVLLFYPHSLWIIPSILWIIIQLDSIQAWCVFGIAVFFAYLVPLPRLLLAYFKKKHSAASWQMQARNWSESRANQQQSQFKFWEEQFKKQQEAIANQAWQESLRQNQNKKQSLKQDRNQDKRGYEQILGLSAGWTQEELKKAYQKEAQRTHPDKWVGESEHLRKQMEAEYKVIQKAYKTLKKRRIP